MPANPRGRKRRARRRPARAPAVAQSAAPATAAASAVTRESATAGTRPERLVEREAPYLGAELRRVATVSAVCLALLALLVAVDRLG